MQRKDARRRALATNGERAETAVARATRPNHAPGTTPEPGSPGDGREPGVRLKCTVDAAQLLTREKLRRVERHWERSQRIRERASRRQPAEPFGAERVARQGRCTQARRKPPRSATRQRSDTTATPPFRRTERSGSPHASKDRKHGEPHDRQQGAIDLQSARWSKPPKPGGTARAERVRDVAAPGQRWLRVVE